MKTTLNKIRACSPCPDGWHKLLQHLCKTTADDEPLSLITVLNSNGLADALWCLRAVDGHEKEKRLYAIWCARQVQHLMKDPRSLEALDVTEKFANGLASREELVAAANAAWAAAANIAWNSAGIARDARSAAWSAAWDAANAAASASSAVGAWDAADAAASAVWTYEKVKQENKFREMFGE